MLGERIRRLMDRGRMVTTTPQASVHEVAGLMLEHGVGAVLVVENETLSGIFTGRDAVFRVLAPGRDARSVPVGEVMTPEPLTVDPEATLGHALVLMHARHVRHLPVLENGKLIGIVAMHDALDPELEEFVWEELRRQSFL